VNHLTLPRFNLEFWRRLLLLAVVTLPLGAVVAAFLVEDWPARRFLIVYTAPLLLAAPLWVRIRVTDPQRNRVRTTVDAGVFLLSFARFVSGDFLPFSGHMLFLTYSGLTTRSARYRILALLLLSMTTWFKLRLWHDPQTWAVGLILGSIAAGVTFLAAR
jgi:hypothetical protein